MFDLDENLLNEDDSVPVKGIFKLFQDYLKKTLPKVSEEETLEDNKGAISWSLVRVDDNEVIESVTLLSGKVKKINIDDKMEKVCKAFMAISEFMGINKIHIYFSDEEETEAFTVEDVLFVFNLDLEAEY